MTPQKADLLEQKTSLIAYLASKMKAGDWHAVQDAASDIRELDAKLDVLTALEPAPVGVQGAVSLTDATGHHHIFAYDARRDVNVCTCGESRAPWDSAH